MRAKNSRGLTAMQERYCRELVLEDKTQTQAYKDAGYGKGSTDKTCKEAASKLTKLEYMQKRIKELQAQVDAGAILNAKQIQAEVANIAMDPESSKNIKLKAFDQLSRMQGAYTDNTNVNTTVTGGLTLEDKRAAVQSLLGE